MGPWLIFGLAAAALVLFGVGTGAAVATSKRGGVVNKETLRRVVNWRADVERENAQPRVTTGLVLAVIARESGGDATALGDAGQSYGLMQIQRATWQDYQTATADPETAIFPDALWVGRLNIRIGSWTLGNRIEQMGSVFEGLRAYNAGVTGAKRSPTAGADYAAWCKEAARLYFDKPTALG